jgi:hypothetical protein
MAMATDGKLELDPSKSPAVLDTTTWDPAGAWRQVEAAGPAYWEQVREGLGNLALPQGDLPQGACLVHPGSHACAGGSDIVLASLGDGQDVFIQIGASPDPSLLGPRLGIIPLAKGRRLSVHPADMPTLERYLRDVNPEKSPRAMGWVPRLGIGNRHTTAVWPAAFRAMEKGGFSANAIQNSVRELNLLNDLRAGRPPRQNHLFGFGSIPEGHTGSTFEGLFHAGVIAALKAPTYPRYGADADHIQVKRGPDGLARAKQVIDAARHYTFFTLDVSDILDYGARLIGKHRKALAAVEELCAYVKEVKAGTPFDLELSIDENPPELATAQCITSPEEMIFLAVEIERRHLPVTHIAPNFGVEKGADYRGPDGLRGLEARVRTIFQIASEYGLMLDCHSGDDLKKITRQVFGRATGGRINFKVSPQLQILFAETLYEIEPDLFRHWWQDVHEFVSEEAARGSRFAAQCLQELKTDPAPHPGKRLFHSYCFVSLGRRDASGRFGIRERLYDLSSQFLAEYGNRLEQWLLEIAGDLYDQE